MRAMSSPLSPAYSVGARINAVVNLVLLSPLILATSEKPITLREPDPKKLGRPFRKKSSGSSQRPPNGSPNPNSTPNQGPGTRTRETTGMEWPTLRLAEISATHAGTNCRVEQGAHICSYLCTQSAITTTSTRLQQAIGRHVILPQ